jgi:protein required for attachment to host cells
MRDFADRITWVAVADGEKAIIFRDIGADDRPDLRVVKVSAIENPANRHQAAAPPGRMNDGRAGSARKSTMEETDFHHLAKAKFAKEFAARLDRAVEADLFDRIIIIAPPVTLGELRTHYSNGLRSRLVAEIDKDLTRHPVEDIEKQVSATLKS